MQLNPLQNTLSKCVVVVQDSHRAVNNAEAALERARFFARTCHDKVNHEDLVGDGALGEGGVGDGDGIMRDVLDLATSFVSSAAEALDAAKNFTQAATLALPANPPQVRAASQASNTRGQARQAASELQPNAGEAKAWFDEATSQASEAISLASVSIMLSSRALDHFARAFCVLAKRAAAVVPTAKADLPPPRESAAVAAKAQRYGRVALAAYEDCLFAQRVAVSIKDALVASLLERNLPPQSHQCNTQPLRDAKNYIDPPDLFAPQAVGPL